MDSLPLLSSSGLDPYRRLVESFAQATWEADADGALTGISPGWLELTRQTRQEALGDGWLQAVHPDDLKGVENHWRQAVSVGGTYAWEYRVRTGVDSWSWTLAHAVRVADSDGRPRWLGMNLDISARKAAEQSLRDASRQKDEFIAVLAHELRNPLAPLRSGIELLLTETATSAARARAIALLSRQTLQISRLIDGLVDASRIATGRLQVHLEKARLRDVIEVALEGIQPAIDAKRQSLKLEAGPGKGVLVNADAAKLAQAFLNILGNSAKFSPEGTEIRLAVSSRGQTVSVVVRDHGRGIPEGDLPHIFKLFVQSARHDRGDGLGIGLALAEEIVRLHGGSIEARNAQPGPGAEFEVSLPALPDSDADDIPPITSTVTEAARSKRVLVVDDNAEAAEGLGALLELSGHTIRIAHDGQEALREASTFVPEIIFMDIGMPVMDGLQATRAIRKLELAVRPFIVALTGWTSEADRIATRDSGSDLHLAKPVAFDTVLDAIGKSREEPTSGPLPRNGERRR